MVADSLEAMSRTQRGSPVTRGELELAVRAELVDFGATSWHASVAADYILNVVDDYLRVQREQLEKRLGEIVDFYLSTDSAGGQGANPELARWIPEDYHRSM